MIGSEVLAEVVRGGFVEGHHHGSLAVVAADGSVEWSVGTADAPMLPRSCLKPLQALAMVRAGLRLEPGLLAVACASHSGEPFHVEAVRRLLARAGLTEDQLQNPPDWPLDSAEHERLLREGAERSRLTMNCSGKHAAMLATCTANGWPLASYLDHEHPLQQAIRATVEELTGEPVHAALVDGCGAPLLSTTLAGLARAFGRLAAADAGPEREVADAIRAHPETVSGTRRDEASLIRAVPGAIAKAGAEGCYAVGLPDGRGVALKVSDGAPRARPVVMAAALEQMGVAELPGVDAEALAATGRVPVLGGGEEVGEVRAAFSRAGNAG